MCHKTQVWLINVNIFLPSLYHINLEETFLVECKKRDKKTLHKLITQHVEIGRNMNSQVLAGNLIWTIHSLYLDPDNVNKLFRYDVQGFLPVYLWLEGCKRSEIEPIFSLLEILSMCWPCRDYLLAGHWLLVVLVHNVPLLVKPNFHAMTRKSSDIFATPGWVICQGTLISVFGPIHTSCGSESRNVHLVI